MLVIHDVTNSKSRTAGCVFKKTKANKQKNPKLTAVSFELRQLSLLTLLTFGWRHRDCLAPVACWALLLPLQASGFWSINSLKQSDPVFWGFFFFIFYLRIEETWRLWQKFLDDYSRFEDWLKISERTAAFPSSSGVLYTVAKEELKKFEVIYNPKYLILISLWAWPVSSWCLET